MFHFFRQLNSLYYDNKFYISENQYKQSLFSNFFSILGYDFERREIKFEVSDGNRGFIDIVVDDNILVEVKSSDINIDHINIFNQTFGYNSRVGKELVIITNFVRMKIFSAGMNNLLVDFNMIYNLNNEHELEEANNKIKILFCLLSPLSLLDKKNLDFNSNNIETEIIRNTYRNFQLFFNFYKEYKKQEYIFLENLKNFTFKLERETSVILPLISCDSLHNCFDIFSDYFFNNSSGFFYYLNSKINNKYYRNIFIDSHNSIFDFKDYVFNHTFSSSENYCLENFEYYKVITLIKKIKTNLILFNKILENILNGHLEWLNLDSEDYTNYSSQWF